MSRERYSRRQVRIIRHGLARRSAAFSFVRCACVHARLECIRYYSVDVGYGTGAGERGVAGWPVDVAELQEGDVVGVVGPGVCEVA